MDPVPSATSSGSGGPSVFPVLFLRGNGWSAAVLRPVLLTVVLCIATIPVLSQTEGGGERPPGSSSETRPDDAPGTPAFRLSGSATITGDIYDFSADPAGSTRPRRPANLWRLVLTPTLTFGDYLTLPFNIMLSSRETNVTTSVGNGSSLLQFLQNPMNNLGFISVAPRFGWAQAYLGTHVPRYSELSSGDGQIFGAGVDLRPGKFRFSMSAGSSQRAIEPDSAANIRGSYARWMMLTKIGYGEEQGTHVDLNIVRSRDDPRSIDKTPEGVHPEEGILFSSNVRVRLGESSVLTGELGTSLFSRDMGAADMKSADPALGSLMRVRVSTRADGAGTLAFAYTQKEWGFKASTRYIGAGYVALGYPYLQSDRLEFLLSPRVQLFDNRLNMTASLGNRTNNLSNTKGETSNQFIGSANVLGIINDDVNVSASYSNFGVRNNTSSDTLKIETVSQSVSLTPSWTIPGERVIHSLSATWSIDVFDDFNTVSGAANSNVTQSWLLTHAATLLRVPLATTLTLSHMTNDLKSGELVLTSVTAGASYRLLEGKVTPSLSATYSSNALAEYTADTQVFLRAAVRWQLTTKLSWNLSVSNNRYVYGSSRPGASFTERFFQTSLSQSF